MTRSVQLACKCGGEVAGANVANRVRCRACNATWSELHRVIASHRFGVLLFRKYLVLRVELQPGECAFRGPSARFAA